MKNLIQLIIVIGILGFGWKYYVDNKEVTEDFTVEKIVTLKESTVKKVKGKNGKILRQEIPAVTKKLTESGSYIYLNGDSKRERAAKKKAAEGELLADLEEKVAEMKREFEEKEAELQQELKEKEAAKVELEELKKKEVEARKAACKFYKFSSGVISKLVLKAPAMDSDVRKESSKVKKLISNTIKSRNFASAEDERTIFSLIKKLSRNTVSTSIVQSSGNKTKSAFGSSFGQSTEGAFGKSSGNSDKVKNLISKWNEKMREHNDNRREYERLTARLESKTN